MPDNNKYECKLDDATRQFCKEKLNETDETRAEAFQALQQWARENPKLHVNTDELSLLPFLRSCKFDLERTQTKLANYYALRRDAPEWFRNRNPLLAEIQDLVRLGVFVPLRKTHDNQLIVIIRTAAHDPKKHKQDDVFKAGKMILDVACMENEKAHIYGVTAIFDMSGVTFGHARQLTPAIIKKAVFAWHNYHCRPQRLEFVNAPSYINVVLSIFKGFMSEKLKGRVQVHYNGLEGVHSIVPKEILPLEYGGSDGVLEDSLKYWHQKLFEYSDWFEEDEQYRAE